MKDFLKGVTPEEVERILSPGFAIVDVEDWEPELGTVYQIPQLPKTWIDPPGGEPLCEEAINEAHVWISEKIGMICFSHPLYHQIFWHPSMNEVTNKAITHKADLLHEMVKKQEWSDMSHWYERPYRTDFLWCLFEWHTGRALPELPGIVPCGAYQYYNLSDREFCRIARSVWTDSENIHQNILRWTRIWKHFPGECWMEPKDVEIYESWPDEIEIWRGECEDGGWSWTLDKHTAEFFAHRGLNGSNGEIRHAIIPKTSVYAYFGERSEAEVIVHDPMISEYEIG